MRDIGPDLRPNDYTKDHEANGEAKTTSSAPEKEPSVVEDLGQLSLSNWGIYGVVSKVVYNLLFKWNGLVAKTLYGILLIYAYIVFVVLYFLEIGIPILWKNVYLPISLSVLRIM